MAAAPIADTAVRALIDKQAITEQIYRYCRSVDRLDVPLGHATFHEDSSADFGNYVGSGRGWIDYICERHRDFLHHSHQVTNLLITLDEADDAGEHRRAGSEAYVFATLRHRRDDGGIEQSQFWARYVDRWSKRDGVWAIDARECVIDFASIDAVTPLDGSARATRHRADPSYAALERTA